jgi:hypothetical protein
LIRDAISPAPSYQPIGGAGGPDPPKSPRRERDGGDAINRVSWVAAQGREPVINQASGPKKDKGSNESP